MNFKQLIQLKSLETVRSLTGSGEIVDAMLKQSGESMEKSGQMRNVCALITNDLFNELESFTNFIGVSKRQFIESAIIKSLEDAKEIAKEVGLFDALEADQGVWKEVE